jgi:glycosyltransferase involved in cell wall biosynthesis
MKKKILLLSDDLRDPTGVGVMSKEIVLGTVHKYDWIQLGASNSGGGVGTIVDVSLDVKNKTGIDDASVFIVPQEGYGNIFILRNLIEKYNPDAILHFTDPHNWIWLYDSEHEIRSQIPILYYHVWDNIPSPIYNRDYYESCDWIGCISKLTFGIVHNVGKINSESQFVPLTDRQISYVPHGINPEIFKPLDSISDEIKNLILGEEKYDFILFYNNRNIRRKQTSDVILSFKLFCDTLTKERSSKCLLLLHTDPVDNSGTDLNSVIRDLCPNYNIKFTSLKFEQNKLNEIYNLVDCTINISNAEGFGLSTAESLMAGTPIIVNVTGGLQDQCGFEFTSNDYIKIGSLHDKPHNPHGDWCVPIWPSSFNITGSVPTPYIFEDRTCLKDVVSAIDKIYRTNKKIRKNKGLRGRKWMIENMSSKIMCDGIVDGIETTIANFKPKKKYNIIKIS